MKRDNKLWLRLIALLAVALLTLAACGEDEEPDAEPGGGDSTEETSDGADFGVPPGEVGEDIDRYQARRNTLQFNRGDGTYAEIANFAGVDASDWTWTEPKVRPVWSSRSRVVSVSSGTKSSRVCSRNPQRE